MINAMEPILRLSDIRVLNGVNHRADVPFRADLAIDRNGSFYKKSENFENFSMPAPDRPLSVRQFNSQSAEHLELAGKETPFTSAPDCLLFQEPYLDWGYDAILVSHFFAENAIRAYFVGKLSLPFIDRLHITAGRVFSKNPAYASKTTWGEGICAGWQKYVPVLDISVYANLICQGYHPSLLSIHEAMKKTPPFDTNFKIARRYLDEIILSRRSRKTQAAPM